jgi:peptide/nickel transport system permease protein
LAAFLARRIVAALILLVLISFASFALISLAPGNAVQLLLAGRPTSPALVHVLEVRYHLIGPITTRYLAWLGGAVQLKFGDSIQSQAPAIDAIRQAAPLTLELAGLAFALVVVIGIPLGAWAAQRQATHVDRVIVTASIIGVSIPPYVSGIVLIYLFAVTLRWLPSSFATGAGSAGRLTNLVLPAVALAVSALAVIVKMTRAAMIRELRQDYVVFARARGLSEARVIVRYALRNALIPVLTATGLVLGYMVGGAVLVEVTFGMQGLGALLVSAAEARDLPMLQAVVMVIAAAVIGLNLLADVLYLAVDPRLRRTAGAA